MFDTWPWSPWLSHSQASPVKHRRRTSGRSAGLPESRRCCSRTKIDQYIAGFYGERIQNFLAFRLKITEASVAQIVDFDLHRTAVVSSDLFELIVLPGKVSFHFWFLILKVQLDTSTEK